MDFLRKVSVWISSGVLKFTLLSLALAMATLAVLGNPSTIKTTLKSSDVYTTAVDAVLTQAEKSTESSTGSDLSLNNPIVQQAAKAAFSPNFLETSADKIIDGTYHWLDGKSAQPDFQVDLAPAKQAFINSVVDAAAQRVNGLPVCTKAQLLALQGKEIDPFNVPCRPAGFDIAAEQQKLRNQLTTSKEFLPETTLSAQTLPKDANGQTTFDSLSQTPKAYQLSKNTPWIFGALGIISIVSLIFVSKTRRQGIRSVGISFISIGVAIGLVSILLTWLLSKILSSTGSVGKTLQANSFQKSMLHVMDSLLQLFTNKLILFTAIYLVIGVGIMASLRFIWKEAPEKDTSPQKETPIKTV